MATLLATAAAPPADAQARRPSPAGERTDFVLTAAGDSIIMTGVAGEQDNPRFAAIVDLLKEGDAVFTNLEETYPSDNAYPAAMSTDTYMAASPTMIDELMGMGFNLFSTANNHTFDYGQQGVLDSIAALRERGATFAGTGRTLGEARGPGYLDSPGGRVAILATTSTFREDAAAGDPRPDLRGRPGLNPLHFNVSYRVDQATFDALKALQDRPGVAGSADRRGDSNGEWGGRLRPTADPATTITVGGRTYELSDEPGSFTSVNPEDLAAITRNIRDAEARAAYVVTSIHAHEGGAPIPPNPALGRMARPAAFVEEFARAAVDAGTDVFFANGPHILRGIEIYKGRPIFYGLGDFFLQNDLTRVLPTEFYNRYRMGPDALPSEAMTARNSYNQPELYQTAIARVAFENGVPREVRLTPVTLRLKEDGVTNFGVPQLADPEQGAIILARIQEMSRMYGTEITIRNGVGYISIP
jgi:poly-gamma-glutamate synthesis protein (capsule biosynthesis protein)